MPPADCLRTLALQICLPGRAAREPQEYPVEVGLMLYFGVLLARSRVDVSWCHFKPGLPVWPVITTDVPARVHLARRVWKLLALQSNPGVRRLEPATFALEGERCTNYYPCYAMFGYHSQTVGTSVAEARLRSVASGISGHRCWPYLWGRGRGRGRKIVD